MKILIVYYSFDGNCKFVAEEINKNVNAEILELEQKEEFIGKSFWKYITGGKQSVTNEKSKLKNIEKEIDFYDFIFFGTPVWPWNYTAPLKNFFSEYDIKNKKVALFCCSGGENSKTLESMKKELDENEVIGEIEIIKPLKEKNDNVSEEIRDWVDSILEAF